jgi:hypothetical protein
MLLLGLHTARTILRCVGWEQNEQRSQILMTLTAPFACG